MNKNRRIELCTTDTNLTQQEINEGYHFCADFDYDVVGPLDKEFEFCLCEKNGEIQ